MIKAILLDLDNTLLVNPDMVFALSFVEHYAACMSPLLGEDGWETFFRKMVKNLGAVRDGSASNTALTESLLMHERRKSLDVIRAANAEFYAEHYAALQHCIRPIDGAAEFIYRLRELDYAVVIATNPIFPETAVKQRMAWGNLPVDDDLYALITHADNMHFAKPDPAYYAEILARVGIEPDEAIMVGDSTRNDIDPATSIGIHTFLTGDGGIQNFMTGFEQFIAEIPPLPLTPTAIAPQLRGNIGAMYGMLANVQESFWHQRPDPNEWSIVQILCHLLTMEETHERPRLERILNEDNPFIVAPKPPGNNIPSCAKEGCSVADEVRASRRQTLALIEQFTDSDWQRLARHSIFGLTTMLEMAYFTAQHDRLHLNQLCQTIGRCG